ncbi:MAG: hypothetical protein QG653_124 [Patescibacteria group bacterium]|nr:hypothetical protein [Patescibacteria group bacterium]
MARTCSTTKPTPQLEYTTTIVFCLKDVDMVLDIEGVMIYYTCNDTFHVGRKVQNTIIKYKNGDKHVGTVYNGQLRNLTLFFKSLII